MEMAQFEKWDTYLVHEHELIERAMAVLKKTSKGLNPDNTTPHS